mgnify:CR=1 FL=1|jgi:hypothetical protein
MNSISQSFCKYTLLKNALREKFETLEGEADWLYRLAYPDELNLEVKEIDGKTFVEEPDGGLNADGIEAGIISMLNEVIQEVENFSKFISHLEMHDFQNDSGYELSRSSDYWKETFSNGNWGQHRRKDES